MLDNRTQVVFDVETLATSTDACIVSIGAVKFSLSNGISEEFVINVDANDCKRHGLVIDPKTVAWWMEQPAETRRTWMRNPVSLADALAAFNDWYGVKSLPTWAKGGKRFDFPIMENAYDKTGIKAPWHYRDCLDYRTIITALGIDDLKLKTVGSTYHSALDDSKEQCKVLLPILQALHQD
jgi:hypothetical protein